MNNPRQTFCYYVVVDYDNGYDGEFKFRYYRDAKAHYDSLEGYPYKALQAETNEGTVYLESELKEGAFD